MPSSGARISWSTPFERLPTDVVEQAKRALLDYLGVAIGGASMPMAQIATAYFAELGGRPEASLLLDDAPPPAIHAALVNGVFGHALDMDDGHRMAGRPPGRRHPPGRARRRRGPPVQRPAICCAPSSAATRCSCGSAPTSTPPT